MFNFLRFVRQHWKRIFFRAHKDKRSLAALLALLGILLYVAYYGVLIFKNPLSLVMLALGSLLAWKMRKSHEQEDESLIRLSDYRPITIQPSGEATASLKSEMLRLWLLLWRASSEQFLSDKSLPDGVEIRTRRVILDKLNELGLWEELAEAERNLHLLPDGEWGRDLIMENIFRAAELEALQYSCGVASTLSPIEDFYRLPRFNVEHLRGFTESSTWQPRETFDIRRERDIAAAFYIRCFAEQVRRGIVNNSFDEEQQSILRQSAMNAGNQNSDLLLGTQIISEVAADKLNIAAGQTHLRFKTLQHALGILDPLPT